MEDLLKTMLLALVDKPEAMEIHRREDEEGITFEVHLDPEDMGQVIGRGGRRAQAIRQIMKAKAMREGVRVFVEITDGCSNS